MFQIGREDAVVEPAVEEVGWEEKRASNHGEEEARIILWIGISRYALSMTVILRMPSSWPGEERLRFGRDQPASYFTCELSRDQIRAKSVFKPAVEL